MKLISTFVPPKIHTFTSINQFLQHVKATRHFPHKYTYKINKLLINNSINNFQCYSYIFWPMALDSLYKVSDVPSPGVRLFFAGRSPAYSGLQRVGCQQSQCACHWERGGELVGVCSVCRRGGLSRHKELVRYLLHAPRQGVVYCLTSLAGSCAATAHQRLCSAGPGRRLCSVARG